MEYMKHYCDAATIIKTEVDKLLNEDEFVFRTKITFNINGKMLTPVNLKRVDGEIRVTLIELGTTSELLDEEIVGLGLREKNILLDLLRIETERHEMQKRFNEEGIVSYKVVDGDTHGTPALIESLTDISVFFQPLDGCTIIPVNCDIDAFADRSGQFLVFAEDYELALWQIYAHDELKILEN